MRWNILSAQTPSTVEHVIQTLLSNRGIVDTQEFLHPTSPLTFSLGDVGIDDAQVNKAIGRLQQALDKKEPIVIYGDYDADGVCATTVLWETMYTMGFQVKPFIPHREHHGYGLSEKGLNEILEKGSPAILISVDNGIVAHEQWKRASEHGIYTIATDHHEPDEKQPPVDCLIHTTQLCGTTVAWMFAKALVSGVQRTAKTPTVEEMLDLCAIATIADQVPLLGANRSFATYGLMKLNVTKRLGLQLLIESAQLTLGEIDTYGVNYGIAPRINAMGRLESALDALRALCTQNREKAVLLISKIQDTNHTRQDLTQVLVEKAMGRQSEWRDEHIILIEDSEFHEGVIGLIAGKLTETFHKPAIVLSVGPLTAKGSARSLGGVHITSLLREFRGEYLLEVGGHPLAAGLKIETQKIEIFRKALYARARTLISLESLEPVMDLDSELPRELVSLETAQAIQTLAPFGAGNREPVFAFPTMKLVNAKLVGKEGKHLKLSLQVTTANDQVSTIDGMAFGKGKMIENLKLSQSLSVAGHLSINEWRGSKKLQIMVRDLRDSL